jgi:hypothetical protein
MFSRLHRIRTDGADALRVSEARHFRGKLVLRVR